MKPKMFTLTYLGPCGVYVDPTSGLSWKVGDSHDVDEVTKKRILADTRAEWNVDKVHVPALPLPEPEPEPRWVELPAPAPEASEE
jgi:hypothetical protein